MKPLIIFLYFNFLFVFLVCTNSCAPFRDSIFSDRTLHDSQSENIKKIEIIKQSESKSQIRIAVVADSHQNYKDLDGVIQQINSAKNIDFVVNLGDFTNSGYNLEYDQFFESFETFKYPAITVLGNHDTIGAGRQIFERMFGEVNFFFDISGWRFIFFNGNNLEDPAVFDPHWLKERVDETVNQIVIFSHVQLTDKERFSGEVAGVFSGIINNQKVKILVNGHNHIFSLNSILSTILIQADRIEGRNWLTLDLTTGSLKITKMPSGEIIWQTLK